MTRGRASVPSVPLECRNETWSKTAMTPAECLAEFERASDAKDWDGVAAMLAPDAVFFFNDGTFRGLEEIRGAFESTWAYDPEEEEYAIENVEWLVPGQDAAACVYGFRWEGVLKGRPFKALGRGTAVLRRDGEKWLIVHEHLSARP